VSCEAADVILLNKNIDTIGIESTDIAINGISGRDGLKYRVDDGTSGGAMCRYSVWLSPFQNR